jgi:two-component system sensor histidine kinase QseC
VETAQTAQGSGLGFSIVERITAMYCDELTLGVSQFGGLMVTVIFHVPRRQTNKPLLESALEKNVAKA